MKDISLTPLYVFAPVLSDVFIEATDVEIQMYCLMMIGNLARTEVACKFFASKTVVFTKLIKYLDEKEQNARLAHLSLGALRNLSIIRTFTPVSNLLFQLKTNRRSWTLEF